jgi:predicted Zn-dependent protease with MMP-like domain
MVSERKQTESAPMNKLNEVANENYKKLSDEFAKSMQQHVQSISDLQQEYLESIKVAYESNISLQKEYFSNSQPYYKVPSTATANTENMINHSNEYTRNLIKWMNIQNKLMAKTTELLKEYVKSYNSAIGEMAEYHSSMIKSR